MYSSKRILRSSSLRGRAHTSGYLSLKTRAPLSQLHQLLTPSSNPTPPPTLSMARVHSLRHRARLWSLSATRRLSSSTRNSSNAALRSESVWSALYAGSVMASFMTTSHVHARETPSRWSMSLKARAASACVA